MTVSSSLTILTAVAESNESRAAWVDQGSLHLLRVDEWVGKYYIHFHGGHRWYNVYAVNVPCMTALE